MYERVHSNNIISGRDVDVQTMQFNVIAGLAIKHFPLVNEKHIQWLDFPSCFGENGQCLKFIL
jgi:hypothetical protein